MTRRRDKRRNATGQAEPPAGAILADHSQQVPNNSWGMPPAWYVDLEFRCRDCGVLETWTAEQQKWYYEVAKGSLYATAVRCRACRQRRRAERERPQESSPSPSRPLRNPRRLLKQARHAAEPAILGAGFVFESRHQSPPADRLAVVYTRSDALLLLRWERRHLTSARLVAEMAWFDGPDVLIAESDLSDLIEPTEPGAAAKLKRRLRRFSVQIADFLRLPCR